MTSPVSSLFLTLVVCGSVVGCGSVVTYSDGPEGGGGEGGGPVVPPPPPPNPAECPSSAPTAYEECSFQGGNCHYQEGAGCLVTYTCEGETACYDDGPCEEYWYWVPTDAVCTGEVVACEVAQSGDPCALPGEYCGEGFECSYTDKWCGEDHVWVVSYWEDECCYDECCYDECWCEGGECPAALPEHGAYCDPCYEGPGCSYFLQTECGEVEVGAYCDEFSYQWVLTDIPVCTEPDPGN